MQIETVGHFQLHLIAHELPGNKWDPFVSIFKFDEEAQDFKCMHEKQRAAEQLQDSYEEAIDAARRAGNALLERGISRSAPG